MVAWLQSLMLSVCLDTAQVRKLGIEPGMAVMERCLHQLMLRVWIPRRCAKAAPVMVVCAQPRLPNCQNVDIAKGSKSNDCVFSK